MKSNIIIDFELFSEISAILLLFDQLPEDLVEKLSMQYNCKLCTYCRTWMRGFEKGSRDNLEF